MNRPLKRTYYHDPSLNSPEHGWVYSREDPNKEQVPYRGLANLVSSELFDGRHAPSIDLDVPAHLVPSKTEGHSHLYIDVPMKWWKYRLLLWVLTFVGIVEPGYYRASKERGASYLRVPTKERKTVDPAPFLP